MTTLQHERTLPWMGGYAKLALDGNYHQASSVRQSMMEAGLDWEVEKVPAYHMKLDDYGVGPEAIIDQVVLRRTTDQKPLKIVGNGYNPFQNRELAEFTDGLIDMSNAEVAGMGETDGGKRVFTVIKIADNIAPGGGRGLGCFIITVNGHGGRALQCQTFVVEWACLNGLVGVVPGTAYSFSLKHTKNLRTRLRFQQRLMAASVSYVEQVHDLYEKLLDTPITDQQLTNEILPRLLPITDKTKPAAATNLRRRRNDILRTWRYSHTLDDAHRRTAWGVVHAVSEWDQYSNMATRRRRSDDMTRLTNDRWSTLTNRARDLVLAR